MVWWGEEKNRGKGMAKEICERNTVSTEDRLTRGEKTQRALSHEYSLRNGGEMLVRQSVVCVCRKKRMKREEKEGERERRRGRLEEIETGRNKDKAGTLPDLPLPFFLFPFFNLILIARVIFGWSVAKRGAFPLIAFKLQPQQRASHTTDRFMLEPDPEGLQKDTGRDTGRDMIATPANHGRPLQSLITITPYTVRVLRKIHTRTRT